MLKIKKQILFVIAALNITSMSFSAEEVPQSSSYTIFIETGFKDGEQQGIGIKYNPNAATAEDIRKAIFAETNIPPQEQKLIYFGQKIEDSDLTETLKYYLNNGGTIYLRRQ